MTRNEYNEQVRKLKSLLKDVERISDSLAMANYDQQIMWGSKKDYRKYDLARDSNLMFQSLSTCVDENITKLVSAESVQFDNY